MSSLNKVILIGRLGNDPEIRSLPSGECVANLSLATSETWKDKNTGQKQEKTEWHRVIYFGRTAEVCRDYLKKGSLILVEGSLQTRKWTDKSNVDHYTTEIKGSEMKMLGSKNDNASGGSYNANPAPMNSNYNNSNNNSYNSSNNQQAPNSTSGSKFDDVSDDIPF